MKFHPMNVNTNTRVRWDALRKLPALKSMSGKKVLDVGAGLGFFSMKFAELGADVLAIDCDETALEYVATNYGIKTESVDVEKDGVPAGEFDLIFIGEILEHVADPGALLRSTKTSLAGDGAIIVTSPALEGQLIHTEGKRLGHHEGSEKHERDGFSREELEQIFAALDMSVVHSSFCVFTLAELFMQTTKRAYLKKQAQYEGQSDVVGAVTGFKYLVLRSVFPLLMAVFRAEQSIGKTLKFNGHCHIVMGRPKQA